MPYFEVNLFFKRKHLMKIATFKYSGQNFVGVVDLNNKIIKSFEISEELAKYGALNILEILANDDKLPMLSNKSFNLNEVELQAPIPRPRRNIFCVGKNYLDHVKEVAAAVGIGSADTSSSNAPEYPIIFSKVPESVIATNATIMRHKNVTNHLDYEAELAVIIGKEGRSISKNDAMEYVWGYTILNDVSARDLQKKHQQWHLAKSLDTFCPMGPWLVSKDEIDITNTNVRCWVNDDLRQDGNTKQFIFDIATIIENISAGITLYPGDIIATGTPSGVGMGYKPPKFLQTGDVVKITIDGIGELVNVVGE